MTVRIIRGDCIEELRKLPPASVHCCVTSPPYWGLRDYGIAGQIGLEETHLAFVAGMVEVFTEARRVLRSDGTLWLNLGDSYSGSGKVGNPEAGKQATNKGSQSIGTLYGKTGETARQAAVTNVSRRLCAELGFPPKQLMGIPWRVALALQEAGWWLRQDIIWSKPNPMPESVLDRCTKAHEYLFLLAKSERYYFDAKAIAEPAQGWNGSEFHDGKNLQVHPNVGKNRKGNAKTFRGGGAYTQGRSFDNDAEVERESHGNAPNETGTRNKRSVWTVATQPFSDAHFATFPPKLIAPCILAGCPEGGTVLDPFGGAGTTGLVADRHGRNAILIELNPEYAAMARRRIAGDSPLFAEVA